MILLVSFYCFCFFVFSNYIVSLSTGFFKVFFLTVHIIGGITMLHVNLATHEFMMFLALGIVAMVALY